MLELSNANIESLLFRDFVDFAKVTCLGVLALRHETSLRVHSLKKSGNSKAEK